MKEEAAPTIDIQHAVKVLQAYESWCDDWAELKRQGESLGREIRRLLKTDANGVTSLHDLADALAARLTWESLRTWAGREAGC